MNERSYGAWWPQVGLSFLLLSVPHAGSAQEDVLVLPDSVDLAARRLGDGPTLLVLHGGPSMGYRYLVGGLRGLAEDHSVVFYDQRGVGRSGSVPAGETVTHQRWVQDVGAVMDVLGEDQTVLVGHSWGGHLALSFALEAPERVAGLVLISTAEPGTAFADAVQNALRRRTAAEDSIALRAAFEAPGFAEGSASATDRVYRAMFRPWFAKRRTADRLRVGLTRREAEAGRETAARVAKSGEAGATWGTLRRIDVPTLIIHGAEDVIPLSMARAVADSMPEAGLEVLPGVGHFPMLEEPARMRKLIQTFLESIGW